MATEKLNDPVTPRIITARYGESGPRWTNTHTGLDFAGPLGGIARASASGVVRHAGWMNSAYGNMVTIYHGNGLLTRYAHLLSVSVRPGQNVNQGQQIGRIGATGNATGPHVHLEVMLNGTLVNPEEYLGQPVGISPGDGSTVTPGVPGSSVDLQGFSLRAGYFVGGAFLIGIGAYLLYKNRGTLL